MMMKRKILCIVIALIAIIITGYNVHTAQSPNKVLPGLNLANMEMLASAETSGSYWRQCYQTVQYSSGTIKYVTYCGACGTIVQCTSCWGQSTCGWAL